jgi:thiamine pyrophosphate-dependent acetolactate synthase large subunit-like protein
MPKAITDQFVEILAAVRVKHVYGIVGDSLNGLTDGMRRSVSLRR